MPNVKRLDPTEVENIIDRIPGFHDRLRMYQHEIATRLELDHVHAGSGENEAHKIAVWLRDEFLAGRAGTVRGDFGLKIAELIESGAYRQSEHV